jgi:hypothetical protein
MPPQKFVAQISVGSHSELDLHAVSTLLPLLPQP